MAPGLNNRVCAVTYVRHRTDAGFTRQAKY
jgi:hypothetical protein